MFRRRSGAHNKRYVHESETQGNSSNMVRILDFGFHLLILGATEAHGLTMKNNLQKSFNNGGILLIQTGIVKMQ